MAIYSRKKNFIFIHIYKCGGNTIKKLLSEVDDIIEIWGYHSTINDVKMYFYNNNDIESFNKAYKFSIVRNPYNWFQSLYLYILFSRLHPEYSLAKNNSFYNFLKLLNTKLVERKVEFGSNAYHKSMYDFLSINNKLCMDTVLHLENIDEEFNIIKNELKLNINVHNHVPIINKNKRIDKAVYNKIINKNIINLINEIDQIDFETFNYYKLKG